MAKARNERCHLEKKKKEDEEKEKIWKRKEQEEVEVVEVERKQIAQEGALRVSPQLFL